jgi:hypothetical protein
MANRKVGDQLKYTMTTDSSGNIPGEQGHYPCGEQCCAGASLNSGKGVLNKHASDPLPSA